MRPSFQEPIEIIFSKLEIETHSDLSRDLQRYIIRKINRAIYSEVIRPWREVLGTDTE